MGFVIFCLYSTILILLLNRLHDPKNWFSPLLLFPSLYFLFYFLPYLCQVYFGFEAIKDFNLSDNIVIHTIRYLLIWVGLFVVGVLLADRKNQKNKSKSIILSEKDIAKYCKLVFLASLIGVVLICWSETRFQSLVSGFRDYRTVKKLPGYQATSAEIATIVGGSLLCLMSSVMAGILHGSLQRFNRGLSIYLHLAITPHVVYLFISLSRGFLLPYAIMHFASLLLKPRASLKSILRVLIVGVIAIGGAGVAKQLRDMQAGGGFDTIGKLKDTKVDAQSSLGMINGLSTLVWAFEFERDDPLYVYGTMLMLRHLSPIPSFIVKSGGEMSLADMMGVTSVGIPMPAIGEIYLRMGYWGLLLAVLFGYLSGYVWVKIRDSNGAGRISYVFLYLTLTYSVLVGMHCNLRAATRGFFWVLVIIFVFRFTRNWSRRRMFLAKWVSSIPSAKRPNEAKVID